MGDSGIAPTYLVQLLSALHQPHHIIITEYCTHIGCLDYLHLFHADCSGIIQKTVSPPHFSKATWSPKAGTGPIAEFLDPRDSNHTPRVKTESLCVTVCVCTGYIGEGLTGCSAPTKPALRRVQPFPLLPLVLLVLLVPLAFLLLLPSGAPHEDHGTSSSFHPGHPASPALTVEAMNSTNPQPLSGHWPIPPYAHGPCVRPSHGVPQRPMIIPSVGNSSLVAVESDSPLQSRWSWPRVTHHLLPYLRRYPCHCCA